MKFTQEYEQWKDKDIYEWMKHKVAAEVGGQQEREAFELFEKQMVDQKGEVNYRLWRKHVEEDPYRQHFLTFLN